MIYFFDLDNTVTASRSPIDPRMFDALNHLRNKVIISGAREEQMKAQLCGLKCQLMSQNGNVNKRWKRLLTGGEIAKIRDHIRLYTGGIELADTIENRGAQISYSFTGHHADLSVKNAYDPDGSKRRAIMEKYPAPDGIEIKIGGTTCLDYIPKGLNKGYNILKYIELSGWKRRDCIYIGDALFPGGNDETVIGAIATFPVKGWVDSFNYITT